MPKRFLLVAGNIGAGKTTLTRRLGERLGWEVGHETVANNPFLPPFYDDMQRWSFHLQVYFLGDRADQHLSLFEHHNSAIADRSIYEDLHIFARGLHDLGNMTEEEFSAYERVHNLVINALPEPDLLLFLNAPVDVLMERIRNRGREIESGITADYLSLLERYYREWLADFDICPVLTIPADNLNFPDNDRHIEIIIQKIEEKLSGKDKVVFPDDV